MKILTATDLTKRVAMPYARFDTLRRRFRIELEEAMAQSPVIAGEDFPAFPVDDDPFKTNGRQLFDLIDVVRLTCTLELEKQGVSFAKATRIVKNGVSKADLIENNLDSFWIGRQYYGFSQGKYDLIEICPFITGSLAKVHTPEFTDMKMASVVACNAGLIAQRVRDDFVRLGYEIVDWEFTA